MKNYLLAILIAGTATPAVRGNPLPAEITSGVLVEGAWVRPDPREDVSEVFIVLNNRSDGVTRLVSVGWPGAEPGTIVSPAGNPLDGLSIPIHSELYMTLGGVRVLAEGAPAIGSTVPLRIELEGGSFLDVPAAVLAREEPVPDHHDYVH